MFWRTFSVITQSFFVYLHQERLRNRITDFADETKVKEAVQPVLITTYGLKDNAHSTEVNDRVVLDDLFKS